MKTEREPAKFPLNVSPSEYQKNQVWLQIRITKYKWFTPPWPSLSRRFESELRNMNSSIVERAAKPLAKAESNQKRSFKPSSYKPPESLSDFRLRAQNDQVYFGETALKDADLQQSVLPGINLTKSVLPGVKFNNSILLKGDFSHADLNGADLSYCDLEGANFDKADLRDAILTGSKLREASFVGANLRGIQGLQFDANETFGMRLTKSSKDHWSVMQRAYTTSKLSVNLLLLALFVLPLITKALFWSGVGSAQAALQMQEFLIFDETSSSDLRMTDNLQAGNVVVSGVEKTTVLKILTTTTIASWWDIVATLVVIYNIIRGWLTLTIAPHKEEYARTHITPTADEINGLWKLHITSSIICWIAYLPAAYLIYKVLLQPVYLPSVMAPA